MEQELEQIEGTVEDIIYENTDTGYTVFEISGGGVLTVVCGVVGELHAGESVVCRGKYENHATYGRQFHAQECETDMPKDLEAVYAFLASGSLPYIGARTANKIIDKFGAQALEMIANDPAQLVTIPGISADKADRIQQEFKRMFGMRELIAYLAQFEISPRRAMEVFRVFGPGALPYRNCNHYLYNTPDVWSEQGDFEGCNIPVVLLCMQPSAEEPAQADVVTLMVPMRISVLEPWFGTRSGRRGADYEAFKRRFAERTLRFAARFFPGLDRGAELLCTSTPLTYLDLTGSPEGSAYGLQKDFNRPVSSLIPVRSRIANLLLTGQNLNVHGMLGVTLSAALTCSELVGEAYLAKKIGYA